MNNFYKIDQIQVLPAPTVCRFDQIQIVSWQVQVIDEGELIDSGVVSQVLSDDYVTVEIQLLGNKVFGLTAQIKSNEVSSDEKWKIFLRTNLMWERIVGPIFSILKVPRDQWRVLLSSLDDFANGDPYKTELMKAAQIGNYEQTKYFLHNQKIEYVNQLSLTGKTALMYAAFAGHHGIVNLLLESGADPKIQGKEYTALEASIASNNSNTVLAFLNSGVDINLSNRYGEVALMYAAAWGNPDLVELLLKNGAVVNIKDHQGLTALDWAKRIPIIKSNQKQIQKIINLLEVI